MSTGTIVEIVGSEQDVVDCAEIPIRTPGGIQPFGLIVGFDRHSKAVRCVTENYREWLPGAKWNSAVPPSLADFLSESLMQFVSDILESEDGRQQAVCLPEGLVNTHPDERAWITIRSLGSIIYLEFERCWSSHDHRVDSQSLAKHFASIEYLGDEMFMQAFTEVCRKVCPSERVLLYRFDEDWNGEVVAESCQESTKRFLNHFFPQSDIPRQVRELYLTHPQRMIGDATSKTVALLRADSLSSFSQDLSAFISRGVAAVHQEYMVNMGVHSAYSMAIIVSGKLWGLLAIHHSVPRVLPPDLRAQLYALSLLAGSRISEMEAAEKLTRVQQKQLLLWELTKHPSGQVDLELAHRLIDCDAVALFSDDEVVSVHGDDVNEDQVRLVLSAIGSCGERSGTYVIDSLTDAHSSFPNLDFAGVLARSWEHDGKRILLAWLRKSRVENRAWGGNPTKSTDNLPAQGRIQPRRSFETWYTEHRKKASPWSGTERVCAELYSSLVQRDEHPLPLVQ